MAFGRTAVVSVFGSRLQENVQLAADEGCINLTRLASGTQDTQQFTCEVRKIGPMTFRVRDLQGSELATLRTEVPTPQVSISAAQGAVTGTFVVELDPERAPITVLNFLNYVNSGTTSFYVNTLFHRVIPGFVVQGGGFTTRLVPKAATQPPIKLESDNGLKNLRGTIAMARTGEPDSATSQFFINLVDNPSLDATGATPADGYAVFGRVVQGLETIDLIATVETGSAISAQAGVLDDVPVVDVRITAARQIR